MDEWELEFYESPGGVRPVSEYLQNLNAKERVRVGRALSLLEEFGTNLSMPHVRPIQGSSLWELRVRGRNQHRVFYVTIRGRRILLLHAFAKKSEKTPPRELRTAESRLADYQERFGS